MTKIAIMVPYYLSRAIHNFQMICRAMQLNICDDEIDSENLEMPYVSPYVVQYMRRNTARLNMASLYAVNGNCSSDRGCSIH